MKPENRKDNYVIIPQLGRYNLDLFLEEVIRLRQSNWSLKVWEPSPALVDKSGATKQYLGQNFDPEHFELNPTGWTHDHCELCSQVISHIEGYGDTSGYESENDWLCTVCYELIIAPSTIDSILEKIQRLNASA